MSAGWCKESLQIMRTIRVTLFLAVAVFASAFAVNAQTQPAGKVGLISLDALAAEGGVTRYISALTTLNKEFEAEQKELQTLSTDIDNKTKELQGLAQQAQQPGSPVSNATLQQKNAELEALRRRAKFKQDDVTARYGLRRQTVVGPVFGEMLQALQEFTVQKGYSMVLDGAKLEEAGILLSLDNKYDVTKEFITFFNARPAGAARANQ